MEPFVVDDPARSIVERGYAFLPGLLDRNRVLDAAAQVWASVEPVGWSPSNGVDERDEVDYKPGYRLAQRVEAAHAVGASAALLDVVRKVHGHREVFGLPARILRFALPADRTPYGPTSAHQDWYYVQGSPDTLTAWIPFADVAAGEGGLVVLDRSHVLGPQPPVPDGFGKGFRIDTDHLGLAWHGGDFRAGDVLLFHSLTIHSGTPNTTNRIRLSMDARFQPVDEPVAALSLQPHYFPGEWDDIAGHWTDQSLARGWESLDLSTDGSWDSLEALQDKARQARLFPLVGRRS